MRISRCCAFAFPTCFLPVMNTLSHEQAVFSIAAVERDTGLSKDTLRVWERRYGFPAPARNANGERLYPQEQLERLRLIRRLLDGGHRPARIVAASIEELAGLVETLRSESVDLQAPEHDPTLLQSVCLHRTTELAAGLRRALMKQGLQRFVVETLAPLATAVGEAWMRGEVLVAEEHLFTEQVQNLLRGAIGAHAGSGGRPRVLLTTLPDELHVLGLLMAEAMLVPEGVCCTSLGTRTPLADIRAAALAGEFDVVALSFSLAYPTRQAVDDLLELRASLPPHVALWAGGGAVCNRHKRPDGVRVVNGLEDTIIALQEWRDAHPSHPG